MIYVRSVFIAKSSSASPAQRLLYVFRATLVSASRSALFSMNQDNFGTRSLSICSSVHSLFGSLALLLPVFVLFIGYQSYRLFNYLTFWAHNLAIIVRGSV